MPTSKKSATLKNYKIAYETCVRKALKKSSSAQKRKTRTKAVKSRCLKKVSSDFIRSLKMRINLRKSPKKKAKKASKRSKRKSRKSTPKPRKSRKRSLNPYQKFVQEQSKKPNMRGLSPSKRMRAISKLWKKQ